MKCRWYVLPVLSFKGMDNENDLQCTTDQHRDCMTLADHLMLVMLIPLKGHQFLWDVSFSHVLSQGTLLVLWKAFTFRPFAYRVGYLTSNKGKTNMKVQITFFGRALDIVTMGWKAHLWQSLVYVSSNKFHEEPKTMVS